MKVNNTQEVREPIEYQGIHFLNFSQEEFEQLFKPAKDGKTIQTGKVLHRYLTFDNARQTIQKKAFWFANPCIWTDPIDKEYLVKPIVVNGEKINHPWKNRVYAMCLSMNASSEALWKAYHKDCDGAAKCTLNTIPLIKWLQQYLNQYEVYIGKVKYVSASELTGKLSKIPFLQPYTSNWSAPLWSHMLLLKRNAFCYEEEVRIMLVEKSADTLNETCNNGKYISYVSFQPATDLIQTITLDPWLREECFLEKKSILQAAAGINVNRSRLYRDHNRKTIHL